MAHASWNIRLWKIHFYLIFPWETNLPFSKLLKVVQRSAMKKSTQVRPKEQIKPEAIIKEYKF
jgi:hypothetical protein